MTKIYGQGARITKTNKGLAYVADYCYAPVDSPDNASPAIVDGHGLALCAAEDGWFVWQAAFDNVLAGVDAEILGLLNERDKLLRGYDMNCRRAIAHMQAYINYFDAPDLFGVPDHEWAEQDWRALDTYNVYVWKKIGE